MSQVTKTITETTTKTEQTLTLFSNVSALGPGSSMQWNGGPAVVMSWWDAAGAGELGTINVEVEISVDGGTRWVSVLGVGIPVVADQLKAGASLRSINLPPAMVRANAIGTGQSPVNLNVVMQGYDQAQDVPQAG